jgi:alginate O-acetyltransferase complex protein AlgI
MSLSSNLFLFLFLPIAFLLFLMIPKKMRKVYLLSISLVFYAIEMRKALPILIFSILMNYVLGLAVSKCKKKEVIFIIRNSI